ncbi:ROK family protein [Liquorilactobacillus sicerae]|uniref:ROK family protein n=1 Tax=Liquorilactobacillus sicerae TaxID=1416943 RepID=UPI002480C43C|nr:ROK family protein [Liquorilactobacillus sicerae]
MLLGSVEAGGTKFICAVGNEKYQIKEKVQILTTEPKETLKQCINFFKQYDDLQAIGVASFGPIETNLASEKYGFITTTPKKLWQNTNLVGMIQKSLSVPVSWTTDVNGSAYGEWLNLQEKSPRVSSLVYYTVGTGIGAGIVYDGNFVGSQGNPELGHIYVKKHPSDMNFTGVCPYHHDCLEGLASGPAIKARLGIAGENISKENKIWQIISYYLAQAAMVATLSFRPSKIIFGGGVSSQWLVDLISKEFSLLLNNYVEIGNLSDYIIVSHIPDNGSATLGNFALAKKKLIRII